MNRPMIASGYFHLTLVAFKNRKIKLLVNEYGRPGAVLPLNGKTALLERIYALAEATGEQPSVQFFQLNSKNLQTDHEVVDYLFPKQNKLKP